MSEKLVDKLRRLRDNAPAHAMKLASENAAAYVVRFVDKCIKAAEDAAGVQGYDSTHVWADTVMTHGNLIKPETVYDTVVAELGNEGVKATWRIDSAPRTNIRKVIYTLSWKDPTA